MDYLELTVEVHPRQPFADLLIDGLGDVGFESFVETENGFKAYIGAAHYSTDLEKNCWAWNMEGMTLKTSKQTIARTNWNAEWEKNFDPILVDDQVYIYAPFHPAKPEIPFAILIEPKMSFGTGHHQTTHGMVQFILEEKIAGKRVLDMGCGTGILGILAAQKGAHNVVGIDIDDWSIENTIENVERNQVEMETRLGGAEQLKKEQFDVILANINLNILLADMQHYASVLAPNGSIIFSGFYEKDVPQIKAEAEKYHLELTATKTRNNWMAARFVSTKI